MRTIHSIPAVVPKGSSKTDSGKLLPLVARRSCGRTLHEIHIFILILIEFLPSYFESTPIRFATTGVTRRHQSFSWSS
jgi:hypothetical protein